MEASKMHYASKPLNAFREQAWHSQRMLIKSEEILQSLAQQFFDGSTETISKALCTETITLLEQERIVLHTLGNHVTEALQLPVVLPLGYVLDTSIRYLISWMKLLEKDLTTYRSTRPSSIEKRTHVLHNIQTHFRSTLFTYHWLSKDLSESLHQSYFREKAMLDNQFSYPASSQETEGRIIYLRPSFS